MWCSSRVGRTLWKLDTFWYRTHKLSRGWIKGEIVLYPKKFLVCLPSDGSSPGLLYLRPMLRTHPMFCFVWSEETPLRFFFSAFPVFSLIIHMCPLSWMFVFDLQFFVTKMISKASFLFEQPAVRNDLDKTANCLLILPHFYQNTMCGSLD